MWDIIQLYVSFRVSGLYSCLTSKARYTDHILCNIHIFNQCCIPREHAPAKDFHLKVEGVATFPRKTPSQDVKNR